MKQTLMLRLEASPAQKQTLLTTMEAFNKACQRVADMAYDLRIANKIALQPLIYNELRSRFGLSSQMAVRAISKACEAYKPDKRVHVHVDPLDPMILDQRLLSFKGLTHVSLLCLSGRQLIPFRFLSYGPPRHDRATGQSDLVLRDEEFFLLVCIDMATSPPDGSVQTEEDDSTSVDSDEPDDLTDALTDRFSTAMQPL